VSTSGPAGQFGTTWIELDRGALAHNLRVIRERIGPHVRLYAVVKANAYGHGMDLVAPAALELGADALAVHSLEEALHLRALQLSSPILVLGHIPREGMAPALAADLELTTSSLEALQWASQAATEIGTTARIHLKVETGTHRQGIDPDQWPRALERCLRDPHLRLEGLATHYANIEDTTDHSFARAQRERFVEFVEDARRQGCAVPWVHTACTAAVLLFPDTYFTAVRAGIGLYGLWPSKETFLSSLQQNGRTVQLRPVLTWKTIVGQLKTVPASCYIGYGCTYRTTRDSRIAVLPIGYSDGYPRELGNAAHVLIHGRRAPVRGRVCMNVTMVDVSDHPEVQLGDEVVLLGRQGDEEVSAELLAGLCHTIHYEIVARLSPLIPRILVDNR
jgi:alanine racemase